MEPASDSGSQTQTTGGLLLIQITRQAILATARLAPITAAIVAPLPTAGSVAHSTSAVLVLFARAQSAVLDSTRLSAMRLWFAPLAQLAITARPVGHTLVEVTLVTAKLAQIYFITLDCHAHYLGL